MHTAHDALGVAAARPVDRRVWRRSRGAVPSTRSPTPPPGSAGLYGLLRVSRGVHDRPVPMSASPSDPSGSDPRRHDVSAHSSAGPSAAETPAVPQSVASPLGETSRATGAAGIPSSLPHSIAACPHEAKPRDGQPEPESPPLSPSAARPQSPAPRQLPRALPSPTRPAHDAPAASDAAMDPARLAAFVERIRAHLPPEARRKAIRLVRRRD